MLRVESFLNSNPGKIFIAFGGRFLCRLFASFKTTQIFMFAKTGRKKGIKNKE
jgi:hypothetical protein